MANFSPRPSYTMPQFGPQGGDISAGFGDGGGNVRSGGPSFNMPVDSPVENVGGPGNPGGAMNTPNYWKGPAPQLQRRGPYRGYGGGQPSNGGINPNGMYGGGWGDFRSFLRSQLGMGGPRPMFGQGGPDPYNRYGMADQSPQLGRYVPPMMNDPNGNINNWTGGGGYSYNIPNSYGSPQWNQFNSTDVAFPQFGQSQNVGQLPNAAYLRMGTGPMYGSSPMMPQFKQPDTTQPVPILPQSPQ